MGEDRWECLACSVLDSRTANCSYVKSDQALDSDATTLTCLLISGPRWLEWKVDTRNANNEGCRCALSRLVRVTKVERGSSSFFRSENTPAMAYRSFGSKRTCCVFSLSIFTTCMIARGYFDVTNRVYSGEYSARRINFYAPRVHGTQILI